MFSNSFEGFEQGPVVPVSHTLKLYGTQQLHTANFESPCPQGVYLASRSVWLRPLAERLLQTLAALSNYASVLSAYFHGTSSFLPRSNNGHAQYAAAVRTAATTEYAKLSFKPFPASPCTVDHPRILQEARFEALSTRDFTLHWPNLAKRSNVLTAFPLAVVRPCQNLSQAHYGVQASLPGS